MRPSTLRSLIKELRAGGVSEYSQTRRGETVTLKLAASFPPEPKPKGRPAAKAAQGLPPISSELAKQLEQIGVSVDDAQEVIKHVGIAGGFGDAS